LWRGSFVFCRIFLILNARCYIYLNLRFSRCIPDNHDKRVFHLCAPGHVLAVHRACLAHFSSLLVTLLIFPLVSFSLGRIDPRYPDVLAGWSLLLHISVYKPPHVLSHIPDDSEAKIVIVSSLFNAFKSELLNKSDFFNEISLNAFFFKKLVFRKLLKLKIEVLKCKVIFILNRILNENPDEQFFIILRNLRKVYSNS